MTLRLPPVGARANRERASGQHQLDVYGDLIDAVPRVRE